MNIKENSKNLFILTFSIIILFSISSAFAQEKPTKNILILNSYHKGFVQTDNIIKGIESVLEPKKNSINLIIEYMDSKVIEYGTQYKEKLFDLYNYKYDNWKFDLIISSDDNAFDFLLEYHEDLFPNTPIVFCGVNNLDAPNLINHNVFTGILEVQSVRETIDLALSLHPETRKIVFIVDDTPTGLYFWSMAQKLFIYYEDIRMIHFDNNLSMEQIENKVRRLSDDTILYFGTFHRDKDGKYYSFDEAVSRVSKASAQPLYGHSVQVLPYGIVGGKLFSGFYHGQVTAELAQCILKGEKVQDIPVLIEPQTQYMFNYEQIQRFGIDTSSLPEGSIIINKPYSFYKENKILIWCVIVFIFIQMVIIIILMMNITKRKKAEEELNVSLQHERFWADIVRNASVGVAIGYPDGHFGMCNIAYQKITGYSEKELQTIDWNKTLTPPEWEESETAKLQELHRTKKSVQYEKEYIRKDGSRVPVELLVHSWFDSDGNVECYFTFVIDISDRKQAEDELIKHREHLEEIVKERTAKLGKSQKSLALLLEDVNESRVELDISNKKLETANKELEAFSYSVSHDLRAPLRAIAGFSQIVLEDYQDKLDKEGEEYLNIIHDNTNLMGNLIDDLLRFSRLGRQKTVSSQIKLKAMIKEVFTEQQKLFPGRKIEFNLQKIPNIHGDRAMIRQVITNLISNALKYTEPRKKTQIEFGCQQKKNEMICYIKDNGVGFDMKYKDKLFKVFQRLHSADEFEGTGVGLALIKLIINKHGGTVWAEGKVNKGATFYFSLPSA